MFGQSIFCPLFYDWGNIGGFSFVRKIVFLSFFPKHMNDIVQSFFFLEKVVFFQIYMW